VDDGKGEADDFHPRGGVHVTEFIEQVGAANQRYQLGLNTTEKGEQNMSRIIMITKIN
jgi:hypothetical protein